MLGVDLDCYCIVFNGVLEVSLFPEGESSIVIEISFARFKVDCLRETLYRFVKVTFSIETDSLVVIGESVSRVLLDGSRIVLYCQIELSNLVIGETSVKKSFKVGRQ